MKPDIHTVFYFVGRIHALTTEQRRRWAKPSRNNFLARHARRLVLAQWLAEISNAS